MAKSEGVLVVLDDTGEELGRVPIKVNDLAITDPSGSVFSELFKQFKPNSKSIKAKFYPYSLDKLQMFDQSMNKLMTVCENAGLSEAQMQALLVDVVEFHRPKHCLSSEFDLLIAASESITIYLSGCRVTPALRAEIEWSLEKHKKDLQS